MGALFALIRQLGTVALIMACATAGTVGLLKLIQKFFGGGGTNSDGKNADSF